MTRDDFAPRDAHGSEKALARGAMSGAAQRGAPLVVAAAWIEHCGEHVLGIAQSRSERGAEMRPPMAGCVPSGRRIAPGRGRARGPASGGDGGGAQLAR